MNYKKDISLNSCKVLVEFNFSTSLIVVLILCLTVLISLRFIERFIYFLQILIDGSFYMRYFYKLFL